MAFPTGSCRRRELALTRQHQATARPGRTIDANGAPCTHTRSPQQPQPTQTRRYCRRSIPISRARREATAHGANTGKRSPATAAGSNERNPGSVRADEIDSYLQHWRDRFEQRRGRPPASGSYRAQINALRAFYAYLDRFTLITNQDGQPLPYPMRKILPPTPKRSNQQRLAPTRRRPSTPALPRQPARMLPDRTAALERPARRRSHQPHPRRHRHKRRPGSDHRPPQQNQRGQTNDPDRPRARTAPPRLARLSRLARP